jgi:hypothetical protein
LVVGFGVGVLALVGGIIEGIGSIDWLDGLCSRVGMDTLIAVVLLLVLGITILVG